jgi:4-coumarate--CoA ligase
MKEMIKVKGIGVALAELEDLLLGHPEVEDVAVLGIADEWAGERPKAYVMLKGRGESELEKARQRLIKYVQEKKVRHKWIAEIKCVSEIPRSGSGKILRRVLRDMDKKGRHGIVVGDNRQSARLWVVRYRYLTQNVLARIYHRGPQC